MYQQVIDFWFKELEPAQWWQKDDQIDRIIKERFSQFHFQATKCELYHWRETPQGRLAEIIILDQFSRNIFRNRPQSFQYDSLALVLSQSAVLVKADQLLTPIQRSVLYLPFMHSESLKIHEIAIDLYRQNGLKENLEFEIKHQQIIEKFGRYPHRNQVLGRISTLEEIEFLKQPNSSF